MSARGHERKLTPADFEFGGILGEGAYAKVLLATRKSDGKEFAVKVVDKAFVQKHNKINTVLNEKKVLSILSHPGIIRLHYTFQDQYSLYYVLEIAKNGEMFEQIQRIGRYELVAGTFYAAQLASVIEHMHRKGVVHRDLKPENILFSSTHHLKITDFGTSKVLGTAAKDDQKYGEDGEARKKSFVGTAEYVSPEVLNDDEAGFPADMWALGCIVYQMLVGKPPFRGDSEYLTFQKILGRELVFPDDMPEAARDLIDRLLVLDPAQRLGTGDEDLKGHPFFEGVVWETLYDQVPPEVIEPEQDEDGQTIGQLSSDEGFDDSEEEELDQPSFNSQHDRETTNGSRARTHIWNRFLLEHEHIVYTGLVTKRRRPFTKTRQLILTNMPRLIYVDNKKMELRGEIPWTLTLWAEFKNASTFYIHTPKRSYYMQGLSSGAKCWVDQINKVQEESKKKS